jgi:pimeloyl-ACP methyl ester carboxylesterase
MFAVSPDPKLLDEYADDAAKASRHALEATLRMLLTSFEDRIKGRSPVTPTLALAGRSDMLLGPDAQRAIAANYPECKIIELDCGHEILVEKPVEAAGHVAEFASALPG